MNVDIRVEMVLLSKNSRYSLIDDGALVGCGSGGKVDRETSTNGKQAGQIFQVIFVICTTDVVQNTKITLENDWLPQRIMGNGSVIMVGCSPKILQHY